MRRRDFVRWAAKGTAFCFMPMRWPVSGGQTQNNGGSQRQEPEKKQAVITAVGDVCPGYDGKHIEPILEGLSEEEAFRYPFARVREYLEGIVFCNLEGTFTMHDRKESKRFNFRADPKYAGCLSDFDIVSMANNHVMDFGQLGLEDTIKTLDSAGIKHVGAGLSLNEAKKEALMDKGMKISFFGYSLVCADYVPAAYDNGFVAGCSDPDAILSYMKNDIPAAKQGSDLVVVSFHWGREGSHYPDVAQKKLAHAAIDNSADIVLGHHPHVLQGIEEYKQGIIFYSLGNFMFSGNRNPKDKDSIIAKIWLGEGGIERYDAIPVKITSKEAPYQPFVVEGIERERVLKKLALYSKPL